MIRISRRMQKLIALSKFCIDCFWVSTISFLIFQTTSLQENSSFESAAGRRSSTGHRTMSCDVRLAANH